MGWGGVVLDYGGGFGWTIDITISTEHSGSLVSQDGRKDDEWGNLEFIILTKITWCVFNGVRTHTLSLSLSLSLSIYIYIYIYMYIYMCIYIYICVCACMLLLFRSQIYIFISNQWNTQPVIKCSIYNVGQKRYITHWKNCQTAGVHGQSKKSLFKNVSDRSNGLQSTAMMWTLGYYSFEWSWPKKVIIHTYIHTYIYIYIYIHTHTHTHVYIYI